MFSGLLLLFTLLPALELYLLFKVGSVLGAFETIMLIIGTGLVGAIFAKAQGLLVLMQIQKEMAEGKPPAGSLLHGFLVLAGGLLLMTPGFLTDFFGICMLLPGTRHMLMYVLQKWFEKQIQRGHVHFQFFGMNGSNHSTFNQDDIFRSHPQTGKQIDENTFEAEYRKPE